MGNFYTNYTLRGPSPQDVAKHLQGRNAVVSPVIKDCVVVFDAQSDEQDPQVMADLAGRLSRDLSCPLLAVVNHDDDVLVYQLFINGELIDEYNSCPGYFDDADDADEAFEPEGGDAEVLCGAFGQSDVAAVEKILRASSTDDDGFAFEVERHQAIVAALGLPDIAAGTGYNYIEAGELPEGLDQGACIRTSRGSF